MRYRRTTVRFKTSRGSEQYHSTKSVIARSYVRLPLFDVRLFRTAVLDCSRSGNANTCFGGRFFRRGFGMGDGLLDRHQRECSKLRTTALQRTKSAKVRLSNAPHKRYNR